MGWKTEERGRCGSYCCEENHLEMSDLNQPFRSAQGPQPRDSGIQSTQQEWLLAAFPDGKHLGGENLKTRHQQESLTKCKIRTLWFRKSRLVRGWGWPETVVRDADFGTALWGSRTGRHIICYILIREKNFKNHPDYNQLYIRFLRTQTGLIITVSQQI